MRSVLLTRPQPCSNQLQTQLEGAHVRVLHLPTLQLSTMQNPEIEAHVVQHWHDYTGVVFVSQHAAQFAFEHMQRLGLSFARDTWLGTVGQGTRDTLRNLWPEHTAFISPNVQDSQDSEGLWRAIEANSANAAQRILIIRAQTGRDALLHLAQGAQIACDVWPCYTRTALVWSAKQSEQFQQFNANRGLIVITSIEGLNGLLAQFPPNHPLHHPPHPLRQHTLITIHPRIAQFAQTLGFDDVRLCSVADLDTQIPIWANADSIASPSAQG